MNNVKPDFFSAGSTDSASSRRPFPRKQAAHRKTSVRQATSHFVLTVVALAAFSASSSAQEDGFRPMLNGKDLSGWVLVNTPPETWSFQDGMLICSGKPIGEMRTEKMYQNFIMEVEWRHMVPRGNAGIFVWADDITAKGQPFHRGIEVQVLENAYGNNRSHTTHGDIFPIHGAKMTPINGHGGSRAFPTEHRSNPSPEWNHYRIECVDGNISLAVNGKVVTRGTNCSPRKGYICIESEGGIVHYRNMKIKELPDTPIQPEHVAIANRNFASLYNGLNLNGWKTTAAGAGSWKSNDWTLSFNGSATTEAAPLTSATASDSNQWIVDVKLKNENSTVQLQLANDEAATTLVDLSDPSLAKMLADTGRWNRVQMSIAGGVLSVTINDQQVDSDRKIDASGDNYLRLVPSGAVDFANIYHAR